MDESLAYQQFSANLDEEESWINEKYTLVGSDDYGDTLAAVQVNCVHFLQITPSCSVAYQREGEPRKTENELMNDR